MSDKKAKEDMFHVYETEGAGEWIVHALNHHAAKVAVCEFVGMNDVEITDEVLDALCTLRCEGSVVSIRANIKVTGKSRLGSRRR